MIPQFCTYTAAVVHISAELLPSTFSPLLLRILEVVNTVCPSKLRNAKKYLHL